MLASAVVAKVCVKLGFLLTHQLVRLWNFKDDMKSLQSMLLTIQAVLSDAERRSLRKEADSERLWLQRLKSAAYDIDDLLSAIENIIPPTMVRRNVNIGQQAKLFLSSSYPFILRITLVSKMKDLKKRLDKITSERRDFDFKVDSGYDKLLEVQEIKNRETFSEIDSTNKNKIIGRDEEKETIVNFLLQKDLGDDISTISIVGLGGLGKTTLAQLIFNDLRVEKEFDIRAWIYVSIDFDLLNIGRTILSQIDSRGHNHDNLQSVSTRLKSALADKRFLIILDDLWEEDGKNLERLNLMLKGGKYSSKVIVTTRSQRVAQFMSTKNTIVHSLEGLSDEDCWSIFSQRAFTSSDEVDSCFVEIGREIIRKCQGVPLAAIALGYILYSKKDVAAWSAVRDSEFWELNDDDVMPSLKLSYYHLPPPLKLCFAYCAIFPKGYDINKDKLIQQWIALEFIQEANGNFTLENIGEEYVSILLGMSFLQYSPNYDGSQNLLCMHDLVHDLARSVVGDEMVVLDARKKISRDRSPANCNSYYWLFVNYDNLAASQHLEVLPDNLRALHFTNCTSMLLPNKVFSRKRSLRVLNFNRCHMENLPDSVYHSKQLRYLEASQLNAQSLPKSFGNFLNMEALDLSKSSLNELPTYINKLWKLKNLSLQGCSFLRVLPESFSELKFLTHLDLVDCCGLRSLPKSFGNLSRLCFLQLSGCSELPNLPQSFNKLISLEHLNLSLCNKLDRLPERFGNLKELKILNLSSCIALRNIPESFGSLLKLEKIDLSYCCNLEKFPESILNSDKLQMLDLRGSNIIKFAINVENFVNTQEGFVLLCDEIFECKEIGQGSKHSSTIVGLEHLNQIRGKLHITHVETVHSSEAERAKLCNKSKLGSLTLQWNSSTCDSLEDARKDELVLEKLRPHQNLEFLTLDGYRGTRLPEWLGELISLRNLSIILCLNLKSLPSSIQGLTALENLHISSFSAVCVDISKISQVRHVDIPNCLMVFSGMSEEIYDKMEPLEKLGNGAFGTTYKSRLRTGQDVAVKSLKNVHATVFLPKIGALGAMNHPHVMSLHACEISNDKALLVYDFMPMGSLSSWLHGDGLFPLNWSIRSRIILDVAHGLEYIHSISPRYAHGNINASNVLVFGNNNLPEGAKINNYGLARLIGGPTTSGYKAPELTDFSQATQDSDVHSFGVLLLEVLTGRNPEHAGKPSDLLGWVYKNFHGQLFFTDLSRDDPKAAQEMEEMLHVAMECVRSEPARRPTMESVARWISSKPERRPTMVNVARRIERQITMEDLVRRVKEIHELMNNTTQI